MGRQFRKSEDEPSVSRNADTYFQIARWILIAIGVLQVMRSSYDILLIETGQAKAKLDAVIADERKKFENAGAQQWPKFIAIQEYINKLRQILEYGVLIDSIALIIGIAITGLGIVLKKKPILFSILGLVFYFSGEGVIMVFFLAVDLPIEIVLESGWLVRGIVIGLLFGSIISAIIYQSKIKEDDATRSDSDEADSDQRFARDRSDSDNDPSDERPHRRPQREEPTDEIRPRRREIDDESENRPRSR